MSDDPADAPLVIMYQGKCLQWLREAYTDLDTSDRSPVETALAGTGCEALFE